MLTDINQTYLGDYFTVYTNIKSLYHIPEINIVLYANYPSIKIKNIKHFFKYAKHLSFQGKRSLVPWSSFILLTECSSGVMLKQNPMNPDFSIISVRLLSVEEENNHMGKLMYKFKEETKVNQG